MRPEAVITQFFSGISNGTILFIVASGLTLIFGVMRVINFAHGSLYMLGAFLAVAVSGYFATELLGFFGALLIVPIIVAVVGLLMEILLFKRIYDKEHLLQLLLTYGLTLILGDVVRYLWGGEIYRLRPPDFLRGRVEVFDLRFPRYDIFLLIIGLLILIGMWFLLQRTRYGRITRAAVSNPEMLSALGVNVDRVFTGVFMLGCWLAGLGGTLFAGRAAVGLGMDTDIIVQAFAVVVIGGLGSFLGALLGSLLIGVTLSIGLLFQNAVIPPQALPFLAMAIILILRPWGLMGRSEIKRL